MRHPLRSHSGPHVSFPLFSGTGARGGGALTLSPLLGSSAWASRGQVSASGPWTGPRCAHAVACLFSVCMPAPAFPGGVCWVTGGGFWSRPRSSVSRRSLSTEVRGHAGLVMCASAFQPWSHSFGALQAGGWVWGACGHDRGGCRVPGLLSSGAVLLPLSPAISCCRLSGHALLALQRPGLLQCWLLSPQEPVSFSKRLWLESRSKSHRRGDALRTGHLFPIPQSFNMRNVQTCDEFL